MNVINKVTIDELIFPFDGYRFNARVVTSVDGGKSFWYCGNGRFFKTMPEAEAYKMEIEGEFGNG